MGGESVSPRSSDSAACAGRRPAALPTFQRRATRRNPIAHGRDVRHPCGRTSRPAASPPGLPGHPLSGFDVRRIAATGITLPRHRYRRCRRADKIGGRCRACRWDHSCAPANASSASQGEKRMTDTIFRTARRHLPAPASIPSIRRVAKSLDSGYQVRPAGRTGSTSSAWPKSKVVFDDALRRSGRRRQEQHAPRIRRYRQHEPHRGRGGQGAGPEHSEDPAVGSPVCMDDRRHGVMAAAKPFALCPRNAVRPGR